MEVQIRRARPDIEIPQYANKGDAGFDFRADIISYRERWGGTITHENKVAIVLQPKQIELIPTGIFMAIPLGYELQIRARSGLSIKHGITLINGVGTIDAGYRNEIGIGVINLSNKPFVIHHGDRIAQGILNKVEQADFVVVKELDKTLDRGGGIGSTGVN